MRISVIIPCYNCAITLPAQLEALCNQTWEDGFEVIVADNGSTDRSVSIAKKFRPSMPSLRVIEATERKGYAHARNVAVRASSGDALLFCDGDDIVSNHWVSTMAGALRENAFVAGRLVVSEINQEWTIQSRPDDIPSQCNGVLMTFGYLPWASASNMGVRRDLFVQVGGFNESMPALEDIDFCWRLQQRGASLVSSESSYVHYRLRRTYVGIFHQALLYAETFVLLRKHHQPHGFSPPDSSVASMAGKWVRLAVLLFRFQRKDFGSWMWHLGWRCGCLTGSLKYRLYNPDSSTDRPAQPAHSLKPTSNTSLETYESSHPLRGQRHPITRRN